MKEKLTSRKLWIAIIGMVVGIVMVFTGNTIEGAATVITSALGYIIAEGYVDAKAVNAIIDAVEEKLEETPEK